jgi:putative acetyltransferase
MNQQSIEIRRIEPDDYSALREICAQPKVVWGTLQVPFPSLEIWKQRLAAQRDNFYGLVACVDGKVVGSASLAASASSPRRRHAAEIGMSVHDAWQGRGIGSALLEAIVGLADGWLNLTRIELTVYTDNAAAIRLYERFGFAVEGTLRRYAFRDGEFVDAYVMARLRPGAPGA